MKTATAPVSSNSMQAPTQKATARLAKISQTQYVAFSLFSALEVVESPTVHALPGSASHCMGMIRWQNRWLPLIDMATLLAGGEVSSSDVVSMVMIMVYQPRQNAQDAQVKSAGVGSQGIHFAAINLKETPRNITINTASVVGQSINHPLLRRISSSCFEQGDMVIPIVSTDKLFNLSHAEIMRHTSITS